METTSFHLLFSLSNYECPKGRIFKKCVSLYSQHHHVLTVQKKKIHRKSIYFLKVRYLNLFTIVSSMSSLNIIHQYNYYVFYYHRHPKTLLLFPYNLPVQPPSGHLFWCFIWNGRNVFCAIKSYHLSFLNKMCFCFRMVSIWINNYFNRFRRFNNFQDI